MGCRTQEFQAEKATSSTHPKEVVQHWQSGFLSLSGLLRPLEGPLTRLVRKWDPCVEEVGIVMVMPLRVGMMTGI